MLCYHAHLTPNPTSSLDSRGSEDTAIIHQNTYNQGMRINKKKFDRCAYVTIENAEEGESWKNINFSNNKGWRRRGSPNAIEINPVVLQAYIRPQLQF